MGRKYTVVFPALAYSAAAQDFGQIKIGSGKITKLCGFHITQSNRYGDANAAGMVLQLVRATTPGTGGSPTTITAAPTSPSDTAYAGVIDRAYTTMATGTVTVLWEEGVNMQAGGRWTPPEKFEEELGGSSAYVFRYTGTPAASTTFTVYAEIEELG